MSLRRSERNAQRRGNVPVANTVTAPATTRGGRGRGVRTIEDTIKEVVAAAHPAAGGRANAPTVTAPPVRAPPTRGRPPATPRTIARTQITTARKDKRSEVVNSNRNLPIGVEETLPAVAEPLTVSETPVLTTDTDLAEAAPKSFAQMIEQMMASQREMTERLVAATVAPKAHAPRMEVPPFFGEMDKAMKWLNQYNAVCVANRWDEPSKLAGLRKAFRDRAATWIEAQYRNQLPATYDIFCTDFKAEFVSSDFIRTAKERFFSCTQKEDESPLAYLTRLKWLRTEIEQWVSEADLLGRAQSGLRPKCWSLGLGLEKSLARFTEKARALEVRERLGVVTRHRQ